MGLYGLASILYHSPAACKPLFVKSLINDVDANYLTEVLRPQQSPEGSSRRFIEEKIVDHFQDFLLSLADYNITGYSAQPQDMGESFSAKISHSPDLTGLGVMGWLSTAQGNEWPKSKDNTQV